MKIKNMSILKKLMMVLVVISVMGGYLSVALAATFPVHGRDEFHGYFTNVHFGHGVVVLPEIGNGQAIPSYIDTVSELVSLLKNYNKNGNDQTKTGSAFIVNTMLGRKAPGVGKVIADTVAPDDWDLLTDSLNERQSKGKIVWNGDVSDSINSMYQRKKVDGVWGPIDDTFYSTYHNEPGILIKNDDNTPAYKIYRRCANPAGELPGLTMSWSVTPSTTVSVNGNSMGTSGSAKAQDLVTWTHTATNVGSATSSLVLSYASSGTGFSASGSWNIGKIAANSTLNPPESSGSYTVKSSDSGSLCRNTTVKPGSSTNGSSKTSGWACVTISAISSYSLTPKVVVNPTTIEQGVSYTIDPTITNAGPNASGAVSWTLTRHVSNAGSFVPDTKYPSPSPGSISTIPVSSGIPTHITGSFTTDSDTDYGAGTRICWVLGIQPRSSTNPAWLSSGDMDPDACVVIGKKPKIQVWGGDLKVGGNTNTSTSVKNNRMFGSWTEYAIFAGGTITGTASGSAFAGSAGAPGFDNYSNVCNYSTLSFVNTPPRGTGCTGVADTIGNYSNASSIPDVAAGFPGGSPISVPSISPNALDGTYTVAGDLILNQGINLRKSVIIKATGTVTIKGNQNYWDGPYTAISQLPQLVIIANKIDIVDTVTNIDAWLVAPNGSINTCASVGGVALAVNASLSTGICNNQLLVNGPVIADKLYLRRTAGSESGAASGNPAEVFNLRADAYLWAYAHVSKAGNIQTVYTTELPPRF